MKDIKTGRQSPRMVGVKDCKKDTEVKGVDTKGKEVEVAVTGEHHEGYILERKGDHI